MTHRNPMYVIITTISPAHETTTPMIDTEFKTMVYGIGGASVRSSILKDMSYEEKK